MDRCYLEPSWQRHFGRGCGQRRANRTTFFQRKRRFTRPARWRGIPSWGPSMRERPQKGRRSSHKDQISLKNSTLKAPAHLRPDTRAWSQSVHRDYDIGEHHSRLLLLACEALDRCCEAREIMAEDGIV